MKKDTILIVDDDPTIKTFLGPFFEKKNYDADYAENGEEAFEKIMASPPDLIISDIIMPRMDGFELYRKLRENKKSANIPFIFLSAKDDPLEQLKGFRMGADEYLTKPFDLQHLFETIHKVLADAQQRKSQSEKVDFSGNLAELNLEDIIQLIEINQKNGELIFSTDTGDLLGSLFFKDGRLIHAVTGELAGEEAFYDLSTRKSGYAKFYSRRTATPETISAQTMNLLFEAARMEDEAKSLSSLMNNQNASFRLKLRKIPARMQKNLGREWIATIVKLMAKEKNAVEIINSGKMSRVRAANILVELIKAGLVQSQGLKSTSKAISDLMDANLVDHLREIDSASLTGILEISGRQVPSSIQFSNGRMDQAYHGDVRGKKALFKILSEKGGIIVFHPTSIVIEDAIQSELNTLLGDAVKEIEFKANIKDDILNRQIIVNPDTWEKVKQDKKNKDLTETLRMASDKKTIREIMETSPLTDLKTLNRLVYLHKLGLIKIDKLD